jgi:uncharacterized protein (TIGR03437 family)
VIHQLTNPDKLHGRFAFALAWLPLLAPALVLAQAPPPYTITTAIGVCTASGTTPPCLGGYAGDGGAASSAELNGPFGMVFDTSGNLYIADTNNQRIREVSTSGTISTVAGNGTEAFAGDGAAATAAELNNPSGLTFDSHGNLYIADSDNYIVREVVSGTINTVAGKNGNGAGFAGDLGPATSATLWNPSGVAVDPSGNIYIADPYDNVVSVVCQTQTPIACTNTAFGSDTWAAGDIDTFAGNNTLGAGDQGDGGPAPGSLLNNPNAVVLDSAGNLYISDNANCAIRKVNTSGIISTIAGLGQANCGYSGDGGPATQAELNYPKGIALDSNGNLFIADTDNCVIRMVEKNGNITTVAGNSNTGCGYAGDGGAATSAQLYFPSGVAVNGGKVYIADNGNNVIRLLTPAADVPQVNAGGVITAGSFGASATVAPGSFIEIYGANLAGNTRTWGAADFTGTNAPTSLDSTSVTIGGQSAYVAFISPGQVNVQVPSNVTAGTQPLIVNTEWGTSAAYNLTVGNSPGIYAPSILKIGGQQYAGALFANSPGTWVLPTGAVSGLTSQPASPGDYITLYGVGFGTVTPSIPAGQVAPAATTNLTTPVQVLFGTTPATLTYQGLAPGLVGLYQFDVQVPTVPANNATELTIMQGGATLPQTLYTAVGN